jgi:hypothetical protein
MQLRKRSWSAVESLCSTMTRTGLVSKKDDAVIPRVLLTDTNRWPVVPRLAIALHQLGCRVGVLCSMPGHPVLKTRGVDYVFRYNSCAPIRSLRNAIEDWAPTITLPCCERGVQHLHALHAQVCREGEKGSRVADLIEHSLGSARSFAVVASRWQLLQLAHNEKIPIPDSTMLTGAPGMIDDSALPGLPCVIKADGSFGGRGVRIARTCEEVQTYYAELTERINSLELLKRLILNRDRGWIVCDSRRPRPGIIAQALIDGRPANCAVYCRDGAVLAAIAVEVICSQGPTGPSTVVQVVEGREMIEAACRIARRLSLSGFFGLDFVIDHAKGIPWLIEMNPRSTPPCALPLGSGRDLPAAMCADLRRELIHERHPVTTISRIGYFPQTANAALLDPWSERSLAGQLIDSIRRRLHTLGAEPCIFEGALRTPAAVIADPTLREGSPAIR